MALHYVFPRREAVARGVKQVQTTFRNCSAPPLGVAAKPPFTHNVDAAGVHSLCVNSEAIMDRLYPSPLS